MIKLLDLLMGDSSEKRIGKVMPYGSKHASVSELITNTEVICDGCGWKWKIKDGGDDPYLCHKCGVDNASE
jgi:hypothetical protein